MKPKEFDNIVNEALESESRKIIEEQLKNPGVKQTIHNLSNALQSLADLREKMTIKNLPNDRLSIVINGVTPEELVDCCGGDSLGKIQTNLMQTLHRDLKDNGFPGSFDIDVDTQDNNGSLNLNIQISPNNDELSIEKEIDMDEQTDNGELKSTFGQAMYEEDPKDENPTSDEDKDLILGDKEIDEQDQTAAGAMAAEEDINEHHKTDKKSRIDFIVKNSKQSKEDLERLSDDEVEKKYLALEKKMGMTESKKKVITLSESELEGLIEKIISEASIESPSAAGLPGGVPGLDVTKKSHKDSGKENADALKAVEKKIKDYLSFEGNDDPEFPNPAGQGEEKVATQNTDSEDEVVDLNRGRNPADLTYDQEPAEQFKERAKMSLVGAAEMGNAQTDKDGNGLGNVVPSKTGENIAKVAEKRKEARSDEPIYDKEAVPVDEEPNKKDRPGPGAGNAGDATASDILRMKQLSNYKESTQ